MKRFFQSLLMNRNLKPSLFVEDKRTPMRFFYFFASAFCAGVLSFSDVTFAGSGWVSSGGEILRDAHNPWFLNNTKTVNYCIAIDSASISASESQIRYVVNDSIKQWQEEFARATLVSMNTLQVGAQKFVEVACTGQEDLRFQFGWGTVSPEQKTYFSNFNFRNFAAFTVRTDYDPIQMRGRGFIYFSSDKGPFRYDGATGGFGDTVDEAWSYTGLLSAVVQHELGHVFGLTHSFGGIMAEWIVDWILNKELFKKSTWDMSQVPALSGVVSFDTSYSVCGSQLNQDLRRWLELELSEDCVEFTLANGTRMSLNAKSRSAHTSRSVGFFYRAEFRYHLDSFQFLYLPPGQVVLPPGNELPFTSLFFTGTMMVMGDLMLKSGVNRMIQIILSLNDAEINGVADIQGVSGLYQLGTLQSDSKHRLDSAKLTLSKQNLKK